MVSDADIVSSLTSFLEQADLSTTTTSVVRKHLEEEFGVDLTDRRAFIRDQIDLFLRTQEPEEEGDEGFEDGEAEGEGEDQDDGGEQEQEEVVEEKPTRKGKGSQGEPDSRRFKAKIDRAIKASLPKEKKKRAGGSGGGLNKACGLSPELQAIIGVTELPRTQVVKQLWAYIREHALQDPENKRKILCDDQLRGLFGVESTDMFKMNKLLSKHLWPLEKTASGEEDRKVKKPKVETPANEEEEEPVKVDYKKVKVEKEPEKVDHKKVKVEKEPEKVDHKKVKVEKEPDKVDHKKVKVERDEVEKVKVEKKENARGRGSGLPRLSEKLINFLETDETEMAPHDVAKHVWDYIAEHKLQDAADRRTIICDEKLRDLFECDTFVGFSLTKLLAPHLKGVLAGSTLLIFLLIAARKYPGLWMEEDPHFSRDSARLLERSKCAVGLCKQIRTTPVPYGLS
ncbi:hypothetical protein R1sor_002429 [Riccia sorocarpa]|uniref:Uncharacterized protein n=1 Tax=Riccia sorocarpa TaxID=122646 RepID=A0ABD3GYS6_9MARC